MPLIVWRWKFHRIPCLCHIDGAMCKREMNYCCVTRKLKIWMISSFIISSLKIWCARRWQLSIFIWHVRKWYMWYDYKIQMWILEMDHCRQCCITNVRSSCDITDENDVESNRCSYVIMIKWALCWWVEWRRKWFSVIDGHRIQCFLFFIWNHVKSCEKMFSLHPWMWE
jgi:hypothetical protein